MGINKITAYVWNKKTGKDIMECVVLDKILAIDEYSDVKIPMTAYLVKCEDNRADKVINTIFPQFIVSVG